MIQTTCQAAMSSSVYGAAHPKPHSMWCRFLLGKWYDKPPLVDKKVDSTPIRVIHTDRNGSLVMRHLAFLAGFALFLLGCPRQPYLVRLVDASNEPLPTVDVKGQEIALGNVGQTYRIEIHNLTKKDVGFMISVDGLDTRAGRPKPVEERGGYLLRADRYDRMPGFEVSPTDVSSFRFVAEQDAFANLQGTSSEMGRIEARFFALKCGSNSNLPFEYTSRPSTGPSSLADSSSSGTQSLSGDLVKVAEKEVALCLLDLGAELDRVVLSYRSPEGKRIGTAGPPPQASPPESPTKSANPPKDKSPKKNPTSTIIDKNKG